MVAERASARYQDRRHGCDPPREGKLSRRGPAVGRGPFCRRSTGSKAPSPMSAISAVDRYKVKLGLPGGGALVDG